VATQTDVRSPLHETVATTATDYWNDSCSIGELTYAIGHGAVGATSNPTIVGEVLHKEMDLWQDRLRAMVDERPTATEDEITWQLIEEMAVKASELLLPVFEREGGRKGRLSIQTNPKLYRNAAEITKQAIRFAGLAPNMQVKAPATRAGIQALEEMTAAGVSVNATVSFTVPQAVAVAEAIERGLQRREAQGLEVDRMGPVCTIMVGRLDDWLKAVAKRDGITVDPGYLEWAGVATFKRAYAIFGERGFRTRLLSAAFRNHMHWSQLVGGDVVISPPFDWQVRLNASGIEPVARIDEPVAKDVVDTLYEKFPDFRRAYDPDGMTPGEFQDFGATRKTLRQFLAACAELEGLVRDVLLPDPEK
jgi:transaldolase